MSRRSYQVLWRGWRGTGGAWQNTVEEKTANAMSSNHKNMLHVSTKLSSNSSHSEYKTFHQSQVKTKGSSPSIYLAKLYSHGASWRFSLTVFLHFGIMWGVRTSLNHCCGGWLTPPCPYNRLKNNIVTESLFACTICIEHCDVVDIVVDFALISVSRIITMFRF